MRISVTVTRLIQVYFNNIDFVVKVGLCFYKITIKYLLFPFFYAIYSYKAIHFFPFFVFLLYSDVYFEHTQQYKKDGNQKALFKIIIGELDFLKKTVVVQLNIKRKKICCYF